MQTSLNLPNSFGENSWMAYGPVLSLLIAGIAATGGAPWLVYNLMGRVVGTPVLRPLNEDIVVHGIELTVPSPLLLMLLGMILALMTRQTRRRNPARGWWQVPCEWPGGMAAYGYLTWKTINLAFGEGAATIYVKLICLLAGLTLTGMWRVVYRWIVKAETSLTWNRYVHSLTLHFARYIGITPERMFLIRPEKHRRTLCIRGCLSDLEAIRLRAGLLMLLPYVTELRVYTNCTAQGAVSQVAEYQAITRARRDAAMNRLHRRCAASNASEELRLPWYEWLLQRPQAGRFPLAFALVAAVVISFLVTAMGLLRPLTARDVQLFFGATQQQDLLRAVPDLKPVGD